MSEDSATVDSASDHKALIAARSSRAPDRHFSVADPRAKGHGQHFERREVFFAGSRSSSARLRNKCLDPPSVVNVNLGRIGGI